MFYKITATCFQSCQRLLPVQTVAKAFAHRGPSDCRGFLCITLGPLPYNIKASLCCSDLYLKKK